MLLSLSTEFAPLNVITDCQMSKNKGKIVREEYFPYLVINGFDELGIVIWVDYGKYFKVYLKSQYNG